MKRPQGRVTVTPAMVERQREAEIANHQAERLYRRGNVERWMAAHDADDSWRRYQVQSHLDDAQAGPMSLRHFSVPQSDPARAWYMVEGGEDRDCGWGRFIELTDSRLDQSIWMSDTRAEVMEHMPLIRRLAKLESAQVQPSVLITGLGLGVAVKAALLHGASRVDVVELDPSSIALLGPQFDHDNRVTIHQGDAFTAPIPSPSGWDVAWHDVWPQIDDRNLPQMQALRARYKARWSGCWQEDGCRYMARILALRAEYEAVVGPIEG
jgi:hypothetical protein